MPAKNASAELESRVPLGLTHLAQEKYLHDPKRSAMSIIDRQIQKKLAMKRGVKKKVKQTVERLFRMVSHRVFTGSDSKVARYTGSSRLGADESGRDMADGVSRYVKLPRDRGLLLNVVIVLGSRAKGSWKPSSDVDVTIIASNLPEQSEGFSLKKLLGVGSASMLSDRPLALGIEPSGCCSKQEFLKRLEALDIQALDALYYGIVLYDDGFWKEAKTKLREVEQRYKLDKAEMRMKLLPI